MDSLLGTAVILLHFIDRKWLMDTETGAENWGSYREELFPSMLAVPDRWR